MNRAAWAGGRRITGMATALRIGTRGSPLALWQANHVAERLRPLVVPRPVELIHVQTEGDRDQSASLAHIGGRGVFTKEIERGVLDGRVDVAVHSLKELPTQPADGLALAAGPTCGWPTSAATSRRGCEDCARRATTPWFSPRRAWSGSGWPASSPKCSMNRGCCRRSVRGRSDCNAGPAIRTHGRCSLHWMT